MTDRDIEQRKLMAHQFHNEMEKQQQAFSEITDNALQVIMHGMICTKGDDCPGLKHLMQARKAAFEKMVFVCEEMVVTLKDIIAMDDKATLEG